MKFVAVTLLTLASAQPLNAGPPDGLRLNELLANAAKSWLELANPSALAADLSGCEIRIAQPPNSQSWTFGPDTGLGPGSILFLPQSVTGLQFPATGGRVELRSAAGEVTDALDFGPQLPAESIGRIGDQWALLTAPSPGNENGPAARLGDLVAVRLNEWRVNSATRPGWIELFNPGQHPVNLAGSRLVTQISGTGTFEFYPLSFIGPLGWQVFQTDPSAARSPWNAQLDLAGDSGPLRFVDSHGALVDSIDLPVTNRSLSWGRLPDGKAFVAPLSLATPGAMNQSTFDSDGDGMDDGWEVRYGLDPAVSADAADDPDHDGLTNLQEFNAGRNPLTSDPPIPVRTELLADGRFRLRFSTEANTSYSVLAGETPATVNELFVPFIADGPARVVEITDEPGLERYFQVVTPARAQ